MRRRGFAIVLVLFVVAAVELITLSIVALATHETMVAAAQEQTAVAARAAESAIRRTIRTWPDPAVDSLAVSQTAINRDSAGVMVRVRRNTWGQYLVDASAPAGRHAVLRSAVLETLDFERTMQEASQVLVTRGPVTAPAARFSVDASSCVLPATRSIADTLAGLTPGYAVGGLDFNELASLADTGLVYSAAAFSVTPAAPFTGILAVNGNITFLAGSVFTGLTVTSGNVIVEDGVHITGAIIVRGGGSVTVGAADLTYSPCAVGRAVLATPAARRLARTQRRFVPAF
jgi:hypothetical protein